MESTFVGDSPQTRGRCDNVQGLNFKDVGPNIVVQTDGGPTKNRESNTKLDTTDGLFDVAVVELSPSSHNTPNSKSQPKWKRRKKSEKVGDSVNQSGSIGKRKADSTNVDGAIVKHYRRKSRVGQIEVNEVIGEKDDHDPSIQKREGKKNLDVANGSNSELVSSLYPTVAVLPRGAT